MKLPQLVYDRKGIKTVLIALFFVGIGLIVYVMFYAYAWVSQFGKAVDGLSE